MNIHERLEKFFRRLEAAPPAGSADEPMELVCRLIEEVEDEFCPLPREEPVPTEFTGRMYAPQGDMIKPWLRNGLKATTRRHVVYCSANGGIIIRHRSNPVAVFRKAGKEK